MTKKTISLTIDENVLDKFSKTGINRSKFCEECMETYVQLDEDNLSNKILVIEKDIKKLQYQKYILTSRYSQDFEKNQEIVEKIPEYWREFASRAGELFFGLCDIEEFNNLRKLSGLLKKDLIDLSEYLVDSEDDEDYSLLCSDFKYCLDRYNKDKDMNLGRNLYDI